MKNNNLLSGLFFFLLSVVSFQLIGADGANNQYEDSIQSTDSSSSSSSSTQEFVDQDLGMVIGVGSAGLAAIIFGIWLAKKKLDNKKLQKIVQENTLNFNMDAFVKALDNKAKADEENIKAKAKAIDDAIKDSSVDEQTKINIVAIKKYLTDSLDAVNNQSLDEDTKGALKTALLNDSLNSIKDLSSDKMRDLFNDFEKSLGITGEDKKLSLVGGEGLTNVFVARNLDGTPIEKTLKAVENKNLRGLLMSRVELPDARRIERNAAYVAESNQKELFERGQKYKKKSLQKNNIADDDSNNGLYRANRDKNLSQMKAKSNSPLTTKVLKKNSSWTD